MSRIGKKPVPIPEKVKVAVSGNTVNVEGPKGKLQWAFDRTLSVVVDDAARQVRVQRPDDQRRSRALHGLTRALIANMVRGVTEGYQRGLELYGTGYSVNVQGRKLVLQCGFARPVEKPMPPGIEIQVDVAATRGNDTPARFWVRGPDKQLVGEFAAEVRHLKPPEPYLGKGFRYLGEHIRRKAGKTFVGGATT
ncbi:MAG: 50S ribosomal protein L6 [Planctomycetes bacterium]|nr:50S ribosomal protein L6 [Planctomycetota bacterium]